MRFTPAMLKTAFAPSQAASGRALDVAAMKAAQGPVSGAVRKVELAAAPDQDAIAARQEAMFDNLVLLAKTHGGKLGTSTVADIEAGRHAARADRASEARQGFRSLVKMNEATYEAAKAKGVNPAPLRSAEAATTFVTDLLQTIQSNLHAINRFGGGDATVGGTYRWLDDEAKLEDPVHAWMDARNRDRLEGSRMDLFVNVEHLKATFGLNEPVLETIEGELQIRAFDIEYRGNAIARSVGDRTSASYRADGTLELDRYA